MSRYPIANIWGASGASLKRRFAPHAKIGAELGAFEQDENAALAGRAWACDSAPNSAHWRYTTSWLISLGACPRLSNGSCASPRGGMRPTGIVWALGPRG